MRWIKKQERVLKTFLFFPLEIDGEVRWMERVKIRQVRISTGRVWYDKEFVNEKTGDK
jgi:hypothetical protein